MGVRLVGLSKRYGDHAVVDAVDLEVDAGAFVVLVGPSGCGKSTVLRMIAGLVEPSAGTIEIDGHDVTALPPGQRDIAMVFQSYALYPHMSVFENIAYPLRVRRVKGEVLQREVGEVAEVLGLTDLLQRRPADLSGGQRQRVAMGRAMVRRPRVFLFDEPLSNLDAALRGQMRSEIARLQRRLGTTTLYVTHDQHEAMTLADRLVLLRAGRIEQQGEPLSVYGAPASRFVAEFLGSPPMGFLPAQVRAGMLVCGGWRSSAYSEDRRPRTDNRGPTTEDRQPKTGDRGPKTEDQRPTADAEVWLGVRPEHWQVVSSGDGIDAKVAWLEDTGSDRFLYAQVDDAQVVVRVRRDLPLQTGQAIGLAPVQFQLFDRSSGRCL